MAPSEGNKDKILYLIFQPLRIFLMRETDTKFAGQIEKKIKDEIVPNTNFSNRIFLFLYNFVVIFNCSTLARFKF